MKVKEAFHLKEIEPGIFLLEFDERADLAYTFLRFQEYYENPHFRGTIFTNKQFEKWYKKFKNKKKFTYHKDWSGFNIPSYIMKPFYDGKFKGITVREKNLLDMFSDKVGKFYVIGCRTGSGKVLEHELTHARFYLNDEYQKSVIAKIKEYNVQELYQILCRNMYDCATWDDEINAYLVVGWKFIKQKVRYNVEDFEKLSSELKKIHRKYFN